MTKLEKVFLGWILLSILYLVSPSGDSMSTFQWVQYFIGLGSVLGFLVSPERE